MTRRAPTSTRGALPGRRRTADGRGRDAEARARAQDLLLNILGGYVVPGSGEIWSGGLVALLADLGCTEPSARMALSRLSSDDLVVRRKRGRTTHYRITAHGLRLLREGHERILSFGRRPAWDGTWTVVSYSMPEEQRAARNDLRKRLGFLGFTQLHQGTWVATYDRAAQLVGVLDDLDLGQHAEIFCGYPYNADRLIARIEQQWDLGGLDERYAEFLRGFQPYHTGRCLDELTSRDCFVLRTELMQTFRQFPLLDPELPEQIVPHLRLRADAVELFTALWHALARPAEDYVHTHAQPPPVDHLHPRGRAAAPRESLAEPTEDSR